MNSDLSKNIGYYHKRLASQDHALQKAYKALMHFMMKVRGDFEKNTSYKTSNVSPGYMDYTYFPFFDDNLRQKKLRFGIVLNHEKMRFELWLMGQNAGIQRTYWEKLKSSKWNEGLSEMPKYAVLEAVIVAEPDFSNLEALAEEITETALAEVRDILPNL